MKIISNKFKKGFTLIELLITISIITILTSITVAVLVDAKKGAENNKKNEIASQYVTALALYHNKYGVYPNGGCTEESECGEVSHVCLGDYPDNNCYILGNHDENSDVNQALAEFAPANLASLSTTIVGEHEFVGIAYGCTEPTCSNYRISWVLEGEGADASCYGGGTEHDLGDVSLCVFSTDPNLNSTISGCTNSRGENFNFFATLDNGSCVINGCMNNTANNYDDEATVDDGSCAYYVCDQQNNNYGYPYTNYHTETTANSWEYNSHCFISGCINSSAYNYNSNANEDDGSCMYYLCDTPGYDNYHIDTTSNSGMAGMSCQNSGCTNTTAYNYEFGATQDDGSCMYWTCNTTGYDNYQETSTPNSPEYNASCANDPILGCTNSNAYNYSMYATQDDGSCTYWTCNTYGYSNYQTESTSNPGEYNTGCYY